MATRQVNAGHDVTGWNRAMQRTTPLAGEAKAAQPIARGDAVLEVLDVDNRVAAVRLSPGHRVQIGPIGVRCVTNLLRVPGW